MQATGVHFTMGDGFSLGDLMKLGLHQYVDACSEIVDRAGKELTIENALKKVEDTWASLSLSFAPYQVRCCKAVVRYVAETTATLSLHMRSDSGLIRELFTYEEVPL